MGSGDGSTRGRTWRWELPLGLGFALTVIVTHLMVTWRFPLSRLVFKEGNRVFFDRSGSEAYTHLDRLATYGAMEACKAGLTDCFPMVLEVADRHHPPVTALAAALLNHVVGLGYAETLLVNLLWLALLFTSVHAMGRRMSGPLGGWAATLLVASTPVIIGPSRLLHQDLPMTALLAAFGALLMALVHRPRIWLIPLTALAGFLAVMTKWEMVFGVASAGLAGGVYALFKPQRHKTIPAVLVAGALLLGGMTTYVRTIPSFSFSERPQLAFLASPRTSLRSVYEQLVPGDDGAAREVHQPTDRATFGDRLLYYAEATPVSAAGLLPTLLMLVGLGVMIARRQVAVLAFGLSWLAVSFLLLGVLVKTFGDDRFVHFFILPLAALGGAGLGSLRRAPVAMGICAVVFGLHLWDMSFTPSPLPKWPQLALPLPGPYLDHPRTLRLRPTIPIGHGTWMRPESRVRPDIEAIQKTLKMAGEAKAKRVLLAPNCEGTCEALYLWVVESLLMEDAPPIGLNPSIIIMGAGFDARCAVIGTYRFEREMSPGAWLLVDEALVLDGQPLSALPWHKLSCGAFDTPAEAQFTPHLVAKIPSREGGFAILSLDALEPFGPVLPPALRASPPASP